MVVIDDTPRSLSALMDCTFAELGALATRRLRTARARLYLRAARTLLLSAHWLEESAR